MAQFQSVAGLERIMADESDDRFAAYVRPLQLPWGMRIGEGSYAGIWVTVA